MKTLNQSRQLSRVLLTLLTLAVAILRGDAAPTTWTGANTGITNGWSDAVNWDTIAVPGAADAVIFNNTGVVSVQGQVNNLVDAAYTVLSYTNLAVGSAGFHTTYIGSGASLNINSAGNAALFVGTGASMATDSINSRFAGPGTLTVTNATGIIGVTQWGTATTHPVTLDLSGLTNFSANVSQVRLAYTYAGGEANLSGTLILGETNFIRTAPGITQPGIIVGTVNNGSAGTSVSPQFLLGNYNMILSDAIAIGGTKISSAQMGFRPGLTGGLATFRGSAGGTDRVKLFVVADQRAGTNNFTALPTGTGNSGSFDSTGNSVDMLITDLFVARSQVQANGATVATFTFDQGTIDANYVFVGAMPVATASTGSYNATGTLNVNGTGTLTVNNDLILSRRLTGAAQIPSGTLNLSDSAVVNVKGNILSSNGISTINFNDGGKIDMQPAGDGAPGNVTTLVLSGNGGMITNANNVTNTFLLNPGTATTAGTLTVHGANFVLSNTVPYYFNISNVATAGGGVNDLLDVKGNVTLSSNFVLFIPTATTLANGSYRLVDYTGTRNGFLSMTNPTRYTAVLDYPANQINVTVGGASGDMRWNSAASALWDLTSSNWFNTGTATTDRYFQLDDVLVDESGAYTNVLLLTTAMYPGSVTVNSATRNYSFGGAGRISGATGITKQGDSTLSISNNNDFFGPVAIEGGVLRVANANALGSPLQGTFATNSSTLDINGISINTGELITISGAGLNNTGAVINTGSQITTAMRLMSLVGDSSIGSWGNRWELRGTSGAFNADANLNGFTLTKLGPSAMFFVDANLTNAGNIVINEGLLQFSRCRIEGSGTITVNTNILSFSSSLVGNCTKPIIVSGGIIQAGSSAGYALWSPITNLSGVTFDLTSAGQTFIVTNVISGAGAMGKTGPGILALQAVNTYTGPTTVSVGSLVLSNGASIATTPSITLSSGTILDVSANGSITLSSGQMLAGSGTVVGNVTAPSANTINAGTSPGTLTINGNFSQTSATNFFELASDPTQIGLGVNDLIQVNGNLTLNGLNRIKVLPLAALNNATPYTLFQYTGARTGGAANLDVNTDSRYTLTLVDPDTTPGQIQVLVSGSGASANLLWTGGFSGSPTLWDTKITSNWLNGVSLDRFFLGDSVVFDDTATTNEVSLVGTVQPSVVVMSNNAVNYTFTGSGSLAAGSLTNFGPGTLTLANSGLNSIGAGMSIEGGSVTLANAGGNTFGSGATVNAGALSIVNTGPNTFNQPLNVNGGEVLFNQPVDVNFSSMLADNGGGLGTVVKQGANTLTLSGDNVLFTGTNLISSGTVRAGHTNALGAPNDRTTVLSGATFDIAGFQLFAGDIITISGNGVNNDGAIDNSGAQQIRGLRGLSLAADASVGVSGNRYDLRGPAGSGSFSGSLSLNNFTLSKVGPGTFYVTDAVVNDPGQIDIVSGAIGFARVDTPAAGNLNLRSNILNFDNYSSGTFAMPITSDGATIRIFAGANFGITSPITNLAGGVVFDQLENFIFGTSGSIRGSGPLTKSGIGAVVLTAVDNDWTNSTTISGGTLAIGSGGADGSLPDLPILNNGVLAFVSLNNFTITNPITGSGVITQVVGGTITLTASNSYTGQTYINSLATTSPNAGIIRISNNDALGTTNGNTVIGLAAAGYNGRLELVGNITVPEPFQLGPRQTTTIDDPHILNVSGNNTLSGHIDCLANGTDYNIQSDAGLFTVAGNFIPPSTAGTRRLKLLGDGNGIYSGIISNSVSIAVATLVTKSNLGTWTLTSSNIYRGATVISGGTLALGASGSINQTASIDVRPGTTFDVAAVSGGFALTTNQTLLGNGSVVGNVLGGGIVSPGVSANVGTLTFANNLVLANTNRMEINRNGGSFTNDHIIANGLTYGGTLNVVNIGPALQSGDTFDLFTWTSRSGSFSATNLPALTPGLGWDLSNLEVNGTIAVVTTVNTNPTNLTYAIVGNTLNISWPADHIGWWLQGQTNSVNVGISNNWFNVAGSQATNQVFLPINQLNGASFFRMVYTNTP